jgi:crotonyl-CoA carboxylase/reductase
VGEDPYAHELMRTNRHKPGNMAVLVNAPRPGLRNFDDVLEAASLPELNRQSTRS